MSALLAHGSRFACLVRDRLRFCPAALATCPSCGFLASQDSGRRCSPRHTSQAGAVWAQNFESECSGGSQCRLRLCARQRCGALRGYEGGRHKGPVLLPNSNRLCGAGPFDTIPHIPQNRSLATPRSRSDVSAQHLQHRMKTARTRLQIKIRA